MAAAFEAKIYDAGSRFFEGEIVSLVVPSSDGMYGILAHHRNVVLNIVPGEMHFELPDGNVVNAKVTEGMLRVKDGEALILATSITRPEDEEKKREKELKEEREEAHLQKKSMTEYKEAEVMLARAIHGLKVNLHNNEDGKQL